MGVMGLPPPRGGGGGEGGGGGGPGQGFKINNSRGELEPEGFLRMWIKCRGLSP